jgi:hypothetical protein
MHFGHWARSKPSSSAMTIAGSGAAMLRTTSAWSPAIAAVISAAAMSRTRASCSRTARGENRPDSSLRCSWWRGSSRLIIEALISMRGRLPWAELYRVASRSTDSTSRYREITQIWLTGSQ